MSGINSSFGIPLLNTLVCRDGTVYNKNGSSSNRVQVTGGRNIPELRYDSRDTDTYYIRYDYSSFTENQLIDNYSDIATPATLESYVGLLVEKPQYYIGAGTTHPAKSLINIEKQETIAQTKTFLNIHEIPNRDHNGLFGNTSSTQQHYWPGYHRVKIGSIAKISSTAKYENTMYNMTFAALKDNYIIEGNQCYNSPRIEIENISSIFLGENDTIYNWPAIKYFGLFKKSNDTNNLYIYAPQDRQTEYYYIESTPDLYLWGELTETNNWYHKTTDNTYDSSKTYYTNNGTSENPIYVIWTSGAEGWIKDNMYEKLGIIVGPEDGASFNTGSFKLIFEESGFAGV